ncbi:MAG TPA: sigma 54-interacting transcriptional regulator [Polyangiaceae bacterium]|nr:sigma 54-interacting transcriptional regulator [Polyangiaceae bacterium]
MADQTTLPETSFVGGAGAGKPPEAMALVIGWAADEAGRLGEAAVVPAGRNETRRVLGRGGPESPNDEPRLSFARIRPGSVEPTGPLSSPRISRVQLGVRAKEEGLLEVENVGRCPLLHNGAPATVAFVRHGDVLELGKQMLLVCVKRDAWIRQAEGLPEPGHPFGRVDRHGFVGESPAMWRLREQVAFVASRRAHALIFGESGTGKELVARALHAMSSRGGRPLVARNAATLPETLVDAELFGSARNYPNAGMPERPGLIGLANGSTLFLDEFAELPFALQTHLLRVLDGGEYHRLGDAKPYSADIRFIGATNRPPEALREDVFARFAMSVNVPSLGERVEDVPLLACHLLRKMATDDDLVARRVFPNGDLSEPPKLTTSLVRGLLRSRYETNVRELEATLWRWVVGGQLEGAAPGDRESRTEPPPPPRASSDAAPPLSAAGGGLGPEHIQACLDEHNGSVEKAWRALGLSSRFALSRLIKKHGLVIRKRSGA